jgi:iron complex outermembrane recepter protein
MLTRHKIVAAALTAACFLLPASPTHAQAGTHTATITGTLFDPSGAVLTGAIIRIHLTGSDRSWSVATDSTGHFTLPNLPAGQYNLSVHQGGFSELVKTIRITEGEVSKQALELSLASVVQQVFATSGPTNDGLTSREIRDGAARDLGEATEQIAGVDKVRKAAIANDIAIRGLFHDNLAMTFDGTLMYGACAGQMDPAAYHVDLSEVDHVDIVKGPFDVSTAGALGGYVKVITKTADAHGLVFGSNVSTGSYGYYNPSATLQQGNDTLHSLFGYSFRTSEFYKDGDGNKVSQLGSYRNGDENLQAFRVQSGWTKLAFEPAEKQRGEISYTRQQSGDLLYPYMTMDGIFDNADRFAARYDLMQPHGWLRAAHGTAYLDKINHLMDNRLRASAGTLPVSMSAQVVSFTNGARGDADFGHGLNGGYEFYRRYWNSTGFMTMTSMGMSMTTYSRTLPGVTENVHGAYISYRRALGARLLLTTGGRYDHSHTDASKANAALYEAYHNTTATTADDDGFSGNVKMSWQASGMVSIFAGVGSNIRFPDPQERFFNSDSSMGTAWVGNPLLTHPRNTEYDLGIEAKGNRYTLSPLVYFSKLDNYIELYAANRLQAVSGVSSMKAQSYANVEAHQWGGELTGNAQIASGLAAMGTVSYSRGTKTPQPASNIVSSNLFQVPPLRSQLELQYGKGGLFANLGAVATGRQNHVDTDEHELTTAGFSTFNAKLGYRANQFKVEAGINNLLAREYSEYLSYARNPYSNGVRLPEPGRNFFINLTYRFPRNKGDALQ